MLFVVLLYGCSKVSTSKEVNSISPIIDQNGADPWVFKKVKAITTPKQRVVM